MKSLRPRIDEISAERSLNMNVLQKTTAVVPFLLAPLVAFTQPAHAQAPSIVAVYSGSLVATSPCLDRARNALRNQGFTDNVATGDYSISATKGEYTGLILCLSSNNVVT